LRRWNKKTRQEIVQLLEKTLKNFEKLIDESEEAMSRWDRDLFFDKSIEACNLLIGLPEELKPLIKNIAKKDSILKRVEAIAEVTQRLLDRERPGAVVGVLYVKGEGMSDQNELELIIDELGGQTDVENGDESGKEVPKKKFRVGVEMEGWGKDGTEINGPNLWEDVEIEAANEDDARQIVFDTWDFGNRRPNGYMEVDEFKDKS